jgi:16S rRNA (cytosine1402-N4)-methyltransferase
MTMPAVVLDPPPAYTHVTVMRTEVVRALNPHSGQVFVDCTLGGGGHTEAVLEAAEGVRVVGFDCDPAAIEAAGERLARFGDRVSFVRSTFEQLESRLRDCGINRIDGLIADLGVSSPQIDDPDRGLSFRAEGPIDMRMDPEGEQTALDLIARLKQDELADVIYQLGDERRSRRIARCIKQALAAGELTTTLDLRRAVVRAVGPRRVGNIDPATRTFQALRIAVNRELEQLERLLGAATELVGPGGTAVFISFHSLEDRMVKRAFQQRELWQRLTAKPLVPSEQEQANNPRSRSAKLRAATRV